MRSTFYRVTPREIGAFLLYVIYCQRHRCPFGPKKTRWSRGGGGNLLEIIEAGLEIRSRASDVFVLFDKPMTKCTIFSILLKPDCTVETIPAMSRSYIPLASDVFVLAGCALSIDSRRLSYGAVRARARTSRVAQVNDFRSIMCSDTANRAVYKQISSETASR